MQVGPFNEVITYMYMYPVSMQEIELQAKRDQFRLDELRQQHLLEKRQLPKKLKAEHKQVITEMRRGKQKKAENFKDDLKRVRPSCVLCCCVYNGVGHFPGSTFQCHL